MPAPFARPARRGEPMRPAPFLLTFATAWFALDRLVPAPPVVLGSAVALAGAAAVVFLGERWLGSHTFVEIPRRLGLGRPAPKAMVAATLVGGAVVVTTVGGAAVLGIPLELRPNWPDVFLGVLLFHGVAEELVWRGFAFGHLRRSAKFWTAIARSVPLIALTHVPIIFGNGLGLGLLAVLSAALTCLPFAYLWERGGRTIWAPAILHGLVGTWQLFERPFPASFSVLILLSSIVVPFAAFLFGDRYFGAADDARATDQISSAAAGGVER